VTYIIMEVQKRFATLSADLELYLGLAPNVLGVEGVHLLSRLNFLDLLLVKPCLVCLDPLFIPGEFISISTISCGSDHVLDCPVDDVRLLQHPLADVFPTIRALLAMNQ